MNSTDQIEQILTTQADNGGPFWSREDGNIHTPHGSGTIDTLKVLGDLGAKAGDYATISKAVDFVFSYQLSDGAFKYSQKSSKLPCMTALILATLGRVGASDSSKAESSYQWLLETQWTDGGWRCHTVKLGKSPETDASNPGTTLYLLDAFRFRNNPRRDSEQLGRGLEFLLQHWDNRKPLGPCNFGQGTRFFQIEYPFLRYNLFYYVYVLSFYEIAQRDSRFLEAYEYLVTKVKNGTILPENPHRAWRKFDFAKPGQVSELATRRLEEIRENLTT